MSTESTEVKDMLKHLDELVKNININLAGFTEVDYDCVEDDNGDTLRVTFKLMKSLGIFSCKFFKAEAVVEAFMEQLMEVIAEALDDDAEVYWKFCGMDAKTMEIEYLIVLQ